MRTIRHYDLSKSLTHEVPIGAVSIRAGHINSDIHVWCIVDPDAPKVPRSFVVMGDSWECPNWLLTEQRYIGTLQTNDDGTGMIVHVFDAGYTSDVNARQGKVGRCLNAE